MSMHDMTSALNTARNRHTPTPTSSNNETPSHPITTAHTSSLPVIDISPFLSPSSPRESLTTTAQAINAACSNYGFFYLTGHGIPESTLDEVINLARGFFALPLEEKNRIKRFDAGGAEGGDSARGYQGLGENVTGGLQDWQEAVDFYRPWGAGGGDEGGVRKTLQGENQWPEEPAALKGVYQEYIHSVLEVGRALVRAMGVALDLGPADVHAVADAEDETVFERHCDRSFWVMRMINYPPLPPSATPSSHDQDDLSRFSCGAHTDYGCVTLLLTDSTPGALQVQRKDGTWLPADPLPGAFVVNVGDMIERWTNGLWKSTMHRVLHRGVGGQGGGVGGHGEGAGGHGEGAGGQGGGGRVSVPFFFEPNFDAVVRPLEKCVQRSGRPSMHQGSTYGEHLLTKVFSNFYYSKRTDW